MNDEVIKLHVCCGDVYLNNYTNIDIKGTVVDPKKRYPKLNPTHINSYYTRDFSIARGHKGEFFVDKVMNVLEPWDYKDSSVDEIVMISCIEHFTKEEAKFIISEITRIMKPKGTLIIDFPDLYLDILQYYYKDPRFMMELIYCNGKDNLSKHQWGYTYYTFRKLLGKQWDTKLETIVTHDYPMVGVVATKKEIE